MIRGGVPRGSKSTFGAGDDYHVALDQEIPVYITYFTLRVNDDGSLTTFNDIYRHDARMNAALNRKGYMPGRGHKRLPATRPGTRRPNVPIVRTGPQWRHFTRTLNRF